MYRNPYIGHRSNRGVTQADATSSRWRGSACRLINPRKMDQDVGRQLHLFENSFEPVAKTPTEIKDVVELSSYNWSDREAKTILVPGSPPVWQDRRLPFVAKPDSGCRTIDADALRFAEHPLEATIASVIHLKPEFDILSKDVITNRNTLRKLLGWATNSGSRGSDFRIDVDILGEKTVAFTRWEKAAAEEVVGFAGFNRDFEEQTTVNAPGCNGTSSHSKVVGYNFGKLNMLVTFDVDACVVSGSTTTSSKPSSSLVDVNSLTELFATPSINTSISSIKASAPADAHDMPLNVISAGQTRPLDTTLKLKTRSAQNPPDDRDGYLQLHLAGAKHLYIGRHTRGTFTHIDKLDFSTIPPSLNAGDVKLAISILHEALVVIVAEARRSGKKSPKMTLLCQDGCLKLMERHEMSCGPISKKLLNVLEKRRV